MRFGGYFLASEAPSNELYCLICDLKSKYKCLLSSGATEEEKFLNDLSNSVRPFDYIVKAGQPARPKT